MKTVRVVLNLPEQVLKDLDILARNRAATDSPPSRYQWLQSANGQQWLRRVSIATQGALGAADLNRELRRAWINDTGGIKVGRPGLHDHRVAVIEELLAAASKKAA